MEFLEEKMDTLMPEEIVMSSSPIDGLAYSIVLVIM